MHIELSIVTMHVILLIGVPHDVVQGLDQILWAGEVTGVIGTVGLDMLSCRASHT